MYTYHPVEDPTKVSMLAESIDTTGWQGMPLVRWGEMHLITGCHRYNAASKVLGWTDKDIPMIDLEEVFSEDGLCFSELHEVFQNCTIDESYDFCQLLDELSGDIKAKYGIDIEF